MTDSARRRRAEAIQAAIRNVLRADWDPLGIAAVAPPDEYDSLIGPVYRILSTSPSREDLIEFLASREGLSMPLTAADAGRLRTVAERLLSLPLETL